MNVLKLGRKALTVSTVFSTILWSVGVTALVPAMVQADTCPTFKSGDLLKVSGHPAIYAVNSNGKVLYFPSGDEFKSWTADNKYGGYTTISQACYDMLPVPSSAPYGVGFRPGSTVVKRPSSDQLYVVEPGNTLAKITLDAAKALYGASFKAMTVADVFWPNYANRGADVTEAKAHPGMLVSNGGKTWLVSADSKLREVDSDDMTVNRFKASMVHAAPDSAVAGLTVGSPVVPSDAPSLSDRTQTGGGVTVIPPVSGGALSVALASDNPAANILASGTAFNQVLKATLTAGSADVTVTAFTLQKSGYGANTGISGVDVVDAQGMRHGNVASTLGSDNTVQLLFSGNPVVVKANSSQVVTFRINLGSTATAGTLQFSLASAAGVTANGTVSGAFPVMGNVFTLQSGSNAVAAVTLDEQPINASGATLNVDATNEQEIAKFSLAETSNKENVKFSMLTLYNNGTAADTDVQDVQLVGQDGTVLATAQQSAKTVVFNMSASPFLLAQGVTKNFTVRAKIVNGAARTIQFTVYNNYDVLAVGQTTGAAVLPSAGTNDTVFPIGDTTTSYNLATIGSGTLSFNKDTSSPTAAIAPGAQSVVFAKYYAKPTGEDMEMRQITLTVNSSSAFQLSGTLSVKVNGVSVWSTGAAGFLSVTSQTLSTYPVLKAGQNSYITIEGSVLSSVTSGSVSTTLQIVQVKRLVTNDIINPNVNAAVGNTLTVGAGALQVNNLAVPVAQSVVVGSNNVPLATIELNAGAVSSGEDVKVTKVTVSSTLSGAGMGNIGNLVMYDAQGNMLATTAGTATNGTTTAFTFVNPILVPKTGAVVLTLKGDVLNGSSGTITFSAGNFNVSAVGKDTGNTVSPSAGSGSGQPMTIASSGTLLMSAVTGGSAAPSSDQNVIISSTQVPVFAFKLTALNEAIKLTSLKLTASGTLSTVNDLLNIKLYRDNDTLPFATAGQFASSSAGTNTSTVFTWTATDNLLPAAVQPGTPVTVYVKADIGGQNAAVLGDNFRFKIASNTDVGAKGASSGSTLAANTAVSGAPAVNSFTYIAPFSVALSADAPTGNQTQAIVAGTQLARIKIQNNGTTKVTINGVKFTDSGSHTGTTTTYKLTYSSQNSTDYTANTASSTMGSVDFTNLSTQGTAFTIDGGAFRIVTVAVNTLGSSVSGDTWQLSVATLGDVNYTALETDLGYDANNSGTISGATASLFADGKPSLATLTKQ